MKIKILQAPIQEELNNLNYDLEVLILINFNEYEMIELCNLPNSLKCIVLGFSLGGIDSLPKMKLPFNCVLLVCNYKTIRIEKIKNKSLCYNSIGQFIQTVEYRFTEKQLINILKKEKYNIKTDFNFDSSIYQIEFENIKFKVTTKFFSCIMNEV